MPISRLYISLACAIHILAAIGIGNSHAAEINVTKAKGENKDPAAPDWAKSVFFVRFDGPIEKGDGEKFVNAVSKFPLLMGYCNLQQSWWKSRKWTSDWKRN